MMVKVLCYVLALLLGCSPQLTLKRALETGDILRLHVIAAGNSDEEQRVKFCVRDAVLEAFSRELGGAKSREEALAFINGNLEKVESVAKAAAEREGYFGPVCAMTGVFPFPDREYEGVLVPKGDYQALRIVLGAGEGQNWWCILYPALCIATSSKEPETDSSIELEWQWPKIFSKWF